MSILDKTVQSALRYYAEEFEKCIGTDLIAYYGPIDTSFLNYFLAFLEGYIGQLGTNKKDTISIVLTTGGGSVEAVEKMVEIIRHHYTYVHFIVPQHAMSAGTIWCMSGDRIFMDYSSSLGPIDPQVRGKEDKWLPALGYLDQFERLIEKSENMTITNAEFALLQTMDLGELRRYEQARDLSITLLKDWLVKYKFKDWVKHRSDSSMKGKEVTEEQKKIRAVEIARQLGDNSEWHSHGRMIGIKTLIDKLRLEIDDYTNKTDLRGHITQYHNLLSEYVHKNQMVIFMHSKKS